MKKLLIIIISLLIGKMAYNQSITLEEDGTATVTVEYNHFKDAVEQTIDEIIKAKKDSELIVTTNNVFVYKVKYKNSIYICTYTINGKQPQELITSTRVSDIRVRLIEWITSE